MDPVKLKNLLTVLRCTTCKSREVVLFGDEFLKCGNCGASYPIVGSAVNFLDPETSLAFGIEETENVSDHPYDGNAVLLIDRAKENSGLVLDCGSGSKSSSYGHVVQLEIVNYPNVDVLAVNQLLPFADESFDVVFSADVLEHVDDPFQSAAEIMRVLKPGGYVYVDLPFLQPEHGYPNHYFNATRQGLRRLFRTLTPIGHLVPASGHPIFTLRHVLAIYSAGLPIERRPEFVSLTVGDLLARSEVEWLDYSICSELGTESQWLIASTTQAVLQKERGGADGSSFDLEANELPGFRPQVGGSKSTLPRTSDDGPALSEKERRLIDAKRNVLRQIRSLLAGVKSNRN